MSWPFAGKSGSSTVVIPLISPSYTAVQNDIALATSIASLKAAGGGVLQINTPGTYLISSTKLLPDNVKWYSAPGVVYKIATGAACNFIRNENWNSQIFGVTSIASQVVVGATGQLDLVISTTGYDGSTSGKTLRVGEYVLVKGAPDETYNSIRQVQAVNPGISVTVRVEQSLANITWPTVTVGTNKLGIAGFDVPNPIIGPFITSLSGTTSQPAFRSFYAPISVGGAVAQCDVVSTSAGGGSIVSILIAEPGAGITSLSGATIDLTSGNGGAAISLASICNPYLMTISKANSDIYVEGGSWDWNVANIGGSGQLIDANTRHNFVFNKVRNLRVERPEWIHSDLYAVYYSNTYNFEYISPRGKCANFGQGVGPLTAIKYRDLRGATQDDSCAVSVNNGLDPSGSTDYTYLDLPDCNGAVRGFEVVGNDQYASGSLIAVFAGRGFPIRGVKLSRINAVSLLPNTNPGNIRISNATSGSTGTQTIATADSLALSLQIGSYVYGQAQALNTKVVSVTGTGPYTINTDTPNAGQVSGQPFYFVAPNRATLRTTSGITLSMLGTGLGLIEDVEVDGMNGDALGPCISTSSPNVGSLQINTLTLKNLNGFGFRIAGAYINNSSGVTIQNLDISQSLFRWNNSNGTVEGVVSDNQKALVSNYGTINDISFSQVKGETIGKADLAVRWIFTQTGATTLRAKFDAGCKSEDLANYGTTYFVMHDSTVRGFYSINGSTMINGGALVSGAEGFDFALSNPRLEGTLWSFGAIRIYPTSKTYNLSISGVNNSSSTSLFQHGTTNVINLKASDTSCIVDGSKITVASSQPGAMIYNNNASFGTGVGVYGITGAGAMSSKLF